MSAPDPLAQAGLSAAARVLRAGISVLTHSQAEKLAGSIILAFDRARSEAAEEVRRERAAEAADRPYTGRDPHLILGVKPGAGPESITSAYRRRAQNCHPDHGGSTAMMAELNAARDAMLRAAQPAQQRS